MILPSDKAYLETKRILQGIEKMKAEFLPLAAWIDKTYDVKTVNIIYDVVDNSIPRIQICFEFEEEKNKFLSQGITYFDKENQEAIGNKFVEIITQQGLAASGELNPNGIYLTDNVFVIYGAFEPVAKIETGYKIKNEQTEQLLQSLNNEDIWTISIGFAHPTFFLYTDSKVKEYDTPEIKAMWADKYYDFIRPFDEFGYIKRNNIQILMDSKENFDKNYDSNWYYYYK